MDRLMIRTNLWKCLFSILLGGLAFCGVKAQNEAGVPNFRAAFDALVANRITYNQYNDSIFLIKEKDEWVSFFKRRAVKNHELFADNRRIIEGLKDYFSQGDAPQKAYVAYEYALGDYMYSGRSDPFLVLDFCKILDRYYQTAYVPDSMNYSNLLNIWKGLNWASVANLGKDSLALRKAYQCFKQNLDERCKNYAGYKRSYVYALLNLSKTVWLASGLQDIKENRWAYQQLKALCDSVDFGKIVRRDELASLKISLANYEEMLVRNVYMVDSTAMDKQYADSLMARLVKRNLAQKNLNILNYQRTLLMQNKLGELTMDEAMEKLMRKYRKERKETNELRLNDAELQSYLLPFFTLLYVNDQSSRSFAKKRKLVKMLCQDIESVYHHRKDQQVKTNYVKQLIQLTTYPRLIKYLTASERVHFLNALNVATQITTYAHSVHVGMIAETLVEGILQYQPELLVGTMDYRFVEDVKRDGKKLLQFAHDAAMYHDLGKNSIVSVVNNDYRPLTDEEFAIIKRHPELGLQYLELAPELAKFHDTTLGHHKWYNGKGGYPESFDNTKSPMRIIIDIVTLSDCMQAATEQVGRNYRGEKTFDTVMAEFRKDAGVRYNPDLVSLIDAHPDLAQKLADLINEGWVEIYYDIYSQYMK